MIKRTLIDPSERLITIEQLRRSMGFSRTDKDDELETILSSATSQVEEAGNISLRGYSVSLSCEYPDLKQPLYLHPVSEITSVKSERGLDMPYALSCDKRTVILHSERACVIEYKTQALDVELQALFIDAVIRLCMWEFNKSGDYSEKNAILNSVRSWG